MRVRILQRIKEGREVGEVRECDRGEQQRREREYKVGQMQ